MAKSPVLLFSVDGMRPDALMQARTPVMDRLIREGTSTMRARTVMPSVTLPCHTSMLRGVDVPRHGITMNLFTPLARPVPSLMDVAATNGKRCAMFYNWGLLRDLCGPESVEFAYFINDTASSCGDERVTSQSCEHIVGDGLDFAFVYLGRTDQVGHDHGWMSTPYLAAIEYADACIGRVLAACDGAGLQPTVLVQSDHGGHERSHGTEMDEDMTIPWVLYGPNVRRGHTLETPVRIFDTCPTLAAQLGLPMAPEWDGVPIHEARI
jgi:arylsulfatase A-like enzyme